MRDAIRKSTFPNGKKNVIPKKKKKKPEKQLSLCFSTTMLKSKNSPQITAKKKKKPAKMSCFDFPDSYSTLVFKRTTTRLTVNSATCIFEFTW